MKNISWNCRGLGSASRVAVVKNLVYMEKLQTLCLQETKLDSTTMMNLCENSWRKNSSIALDSRGVSGGLCTIWNPDYLDLMDSEMTPSSILTIFKKKDVDQTIIVINVYSPFVYIQNVVFWDSLNQLTQQRPAYPSIIGGNFNTTLLTNEKRGWGGVKGSRPLQRTNGGFYVF